MARIFSFRFKMERLLATATEDDRHPLETTEQEEEKQTFLLRILIICFWGALGMLSRPGKCSCFSGLSVKPLNSRRCLIAEFRCVSKFAQD